jgi:hypothetical protein
MQQRGIVTCHNHMSPLQHNGVRCDRRTSLFYNPLECRCSAPSALPPCFASLSSLAPPPLSDCQRLPIQTSRRNLTVAQPAGLDHPNPAFTSEFEGGTTRWSQPSANHCACHNHQPGPRPSSPSRPSSSSSFPSTSPPPYQTGDSLLRSSHSFLCVVCWINENYAS